MKKTAKVLTLITLLLSSFTVSCNNNAKPVPIDPTPAPTLKTFEGITFESATFVYNGSAHAIYVKNVPDFATVTYLNNNKTAVGEYTVEATIEAEGYQKLVLLANMTISNPAKKDFEGIIMEDLTVEYNGDYHNIMPQNVPSFAKVSCDTTYLGYKDPSREPYTINVTVKADGYNPLSLSAKLTITGKEMPKPVLEDQIIYYTGYSESFTMYPTNLLLDAKVYKIDGVRYSYTDVNTEGYDISYRIHKDGYYDEIVSAKFYIILHQFEGITFEDKDVFYVNEPHGIEITTANKLPSYTTVTYEVLNNPNYTGKYEELKIKDVGTYQVKATVSNERLSYATLELTATINIIDPTLYVGVDESKTMFTFDSSLKYQQLIDVLAGNNYSVHIRCWDEYYDVIPAYQNIAYNHDSLYIDSYIDGDNMLEYENYVGETDGYNSVKIGYKQEDKYLVQEFYNSYSFENLCSRERALEKCNLDDLPSLYFTESSDGGFEPSSYTYNRLTRYTSEDFTIKDNSFTFTYKIMYFHPEFNHNEVTVVTIYNIGNTRVEIPEMFIK